MQVPTAPPWRAVGHTGYQVNAGPAYNTVSAPRTLFRPTPTEPVYVSSPPHPPPPPAKRKIDWPQPVRNYVQRSFVPENNIPGIEREEMEEKLKQVISRATESNTLGSTDWENLALPQQMILEERKRVITDWNDVSWPQPSSNHNVQPPVTPFVAAPSKKRKSSPLEPVHEDDINQPPWRKTNNRNLFEDRITYPPNDKRQRLDYNSKTPSKSQASLEKRKKRFENSRSGISSPSAGVSSRDDSPVPVATPPGPIVGRSEVLEKRYLRLTSEANPDNVRPFHILEKTLDLLKKKWKKENNYAYICDQFKSLRQDLTVQHIKCEFTTSVYEIHARIALEKGDMGEYNQCQTQLRGLYAENLGGHPMEFLAYRILYFINIQNRVELNDTLAHLTPADKKAQAVKHALDVRSSLALGNYHRFFQLYLETPNMGAYLMDKFVGRERLAAMAKISKGYTADVPIRFITEELGFESDEESVRFILEYVDASVLAEREDGLRFLTKRAGSAFETASQEAFRVVDIKGQL